jgi:hypothetical protein
MGEALNRLIDYFRSGDGYDRLLWAIILLLLTTIFEFIKSQLIKLVKLIWKYTKKLLKMVYDKTSQFLKRISEKFKYRQTIRKIEKGKMGIPPHFLMGKTREKNPELLGIFKLIDEGVLEEPEELKIARYFEKHPIDFDRLLSSQVNMNVYVKTPDCIKNFKVDK